MSKRIDNRFIIYHSAAQQCDLCGNIDELRPYGPNGEFICFECGMKDEETTKNMFEKAIDGIDKIEVVIEGSPN